MHLREQHFPPSHKSAMEALVGRLIDSTSPSHSLEWMSRPRRTGSGEAGAVHPKIAARCGWRDFSDVGGPGDVLASVRSVEQADVATR